MKELSSIGKNVIILCLAAGLILLGFLCYKETKKTEHAENGIKFNPQGKPDLNLPPAKTYTDTAGRNHAVYSAEKNKIIEGEADRIVQQQLKPTVDSIAKSNGIKPKQVEGYMVISTTSQGLELKAMAKEMDSLRRLTIYYKDKYLELAYRPADPKDTTDLGSFDYKYNADLAIDQYWKRSFFLGAGKSYLDIYSNDKRTTINGVKRLSIIQPPSTLGARLEALTSYNFHTRDLLPGAGVRFDIGKFTARGAMFYNTTEKLFIPTIEGAYTIFSIK